MGLLLALLAAESIGCAYPFYREDRFPGDLGVLLNRLTGPEDLIVMVSNWDPAVLYFADRRGWMVREAYDLKRIERLAEAGARYYADVFRGERAQHPGFFGAMDERFERLSPQDAPGPILFSKDFAFSSAIVASFFGTSFAHAGRGKAPEFNRFLFVQRPDGEEMLPRHLRNTAA